MDHGGFNWDAGKHGVSKAEIEDRFIAVYRNQDGRPMFIGFTFREVGGKRLVRPVTARYMHAKEAQRYAAQSAENEDR